MIDEENIKNESIHRGLYKAGENCDYGVVDTGMITEYNKSYEELEKQIKECEGKHLQQVVYSTYHKALTQICFNCKKVRTQIREEDINKKMAVDERIKNIKIAVHNEEESRQVQEKLFELGAGWSGGIIIKYTNPRYLFCYDGIISYVLNDKRYFDNHENKEIYAKDLLEMEKQEEKSLIDKLNDRIDLIELERGNLSYKNKNYNYINNYYKGGIHEIKSIKNRNILQTKEKILEDYRNNKRKHSMSVSELEEILNKRIGEIK